MTAITLTHIGGPTALIDFGGIRLLTDPTFDAGGNAYSMGPVTLHKTTGPAIAASEIGPVDCVLLSHDHHADNLDNAGRAMLASAIGAGMGEVPSFFVTGTPLKPLPELWTISVSPENSMTRPVTSRRSPRA